MITHNPGKWKYHRYPIHNIIGYKKQVKRVSELQLNRAGAVRVLNFPGEPPGCMPFDNSSIKRPENHHPDKTGEV